MPIPLSDVPPIAAQLGEDTLHVWRLDYDRRDGRAPLHALLGAYLGLPGDAVALQEDAHGRPRLAVESARPLDFNWSHSGGCALVAVGLGIVPGIDLERRRARPKALPIARRYFVPAEAQWLASLPAERHDDAFLALWTAKEAVLKALGRGLAFGLHRLEIDLRGDTPRLAHLHGETACEWRLHPLDVDPAYRAAVAWRGPARAVQYRRLAWTP